jgi:hypothetical protein
VQAGATDRMSLAWSGPICTLQGGVVVWWGRAR